MVSQPFAILRGQKKDFGNKFKHGTRSLDFKKSTNTFGFFFTDKVSTANSYSKGTYGNIMQVYLCLKNPLDMRNLPLIPTEKQFIAFLNKIGLTNYKSQSKLNIPIPIFQFFDEYGESLRYDLQSLGYDGIIFEDVSALGTTYIAFYPNQIKSATGNDGTWDIDDDSILSGSEEEISFKNLQEYGIYHGLLNEKMSNSFQKFINQNKYKYAILYHGTSAKHNIMEKGILPTTAKKRNWYQSSPGFVYLSNYPSYAKMYGEYAYPYDDIVVYKVRVPIKDLKPDLNILKDYNIANPDEHVKPTLANSIIHGNSVRVARKIYPYEIIGVEVLKRHNPGSSVVESKTFNLFGIELFDKNLSGANNDTNDNLLQDSLIDNKKRFYSIYERANGKYADYFLVVENLLGLELHYHYGDIVQVYQHNTTYHYVYLGFRKNPYNNSLKYYDHNVLSHSNSNTSTFSEEELTLAKKRNQVEELAKISYDEVNELIDKGYLENSWYYRVGGTYKYHYKGKEYVTEKEPVLIFRKHWDYDAKGGGIKIKQSGINKIKKIRKRIKTNGKNSKKCV